MAFEAMAHRQADDEDERDDDAKDNELDLHVLKPHLSPNLCTLLSEILCLQTVYIGILSYRYTDWYIQIGHVT